MNILRYIATAVAIAAQIAAMAQPALIPQPRSVKLTSQSPVWPKTIVYDTLKCQADTLAEAYSISVDPAQISITAYSPQGFVWAQRTLEQLKAEDGSYPQVQIWDRPEFPIRGFMYDSGRNFIEIDQVKEFIDLCSRYKLNAFHWHLTDKPAWRVECRVYPQLNDAQYQRIGREAGRYYTWDEIHDVARYAKERGVFIIPELDMPGHSDYFLTTFGTTMNTKEGMEILDKCLNEFFTEFSAEEFPYVHIGSDEIHIDNPEEFMQWAEKAVLHAGRIPIVWDPGLDASHNTIFQVWRDGSANPEEIPEGKKVLDSYMGYLNYVDPMIMTNRLFLHKPCPAGHSDPFNLGGILCLWNDVRVIDDTRIPVHNSMMGGMLPFAERFWRGQEGNAKNLDILLPADDADMQRLAEFQQRMAEHKSRLLPEELAHWQPNRPSTVWDVEITDSLGQVLHSGPAYGDVVDLDALCAIWDIKGNVSAKLSRTVEVAADTVVMCRIGFEAAPRSNRNSDGIPLQGEWENYGSVTVNGNRVLPPVWIEPGMYKFHFNTWARPQEELAYTDEQFYWTREPVALNLKKGKNIIELSTRRHFKGQRFQAALLDL